MYVEVVEVAIDKDNPFRYRKNDKYGNLEKWFKLRHIEGHLSFSAYTNKEAAERALKESRNG